MKKIITIFVVIVSIFYLYLNFFVWNESTQIILNDYSKFTGQNNIVLTGKVLNSKQFFILGQEVILNTDFSFKKEIFLFKGMNKINLKVITKNNDIIYKNIQIFCTKKS